MVKVKYPIGIQSFERLIEGNYIYVDKTSYIRELVDNASVYFLGRPRRFGKSLLLSTLHAFFEGRRDLFSGLDIDSWEEWDWAEYPVIHLDFNAKDYTYKDSVYERLNEQLEVYESKYGISDIATSLDERFRQIIACAHNHTGRNVVVLIDEYDKPILDTIHDPKIKEMHRDTLRAFYASLKSSDQYLKFVFLTGVTKFGQMNVFSGLNNIQDISLSERYSGICGITEEELHEYFSEGVEACAHKWECTPEEVYKILKENYDGYHFSYNLLDVYNPWSALNALAQQFITTYWNQTGGGLSFLYKVISNGDIPISDLSNVEARPQELTGVNLDIDDAITLLYQSGYLTIKSYDRTTNLFTLKYPNKEVESGFFDHLLPYYSGMGVTASGFAINKLLKDLRNGDAEGYIERMQSFFEDFPYENALKTEKDFQNVMYCIARLLGLQTKVEQHSARGRVDMLVETPRYVYIMEFKVNKSTKKAVEQIEKRRYAIPFIKDDREVIKLSVEFSTEERNITDWKIS